MNATEKSITICSGFSISVSYDKEAVATHIANQVKSFTIFLLSLIESALQSSQQKVEEVIEEVSSFSTAVQSYVTTKIQLVITPVKTKIIAGQSFITLSYTRFKKHLTMVDASSS